jgi:hypothetical protein
MRKVISLLIFLFVSTIALTGCGYGVKKSIEKSIKDFLSLYYTIDNYTSYKTIIEESSKNLVEEEE